MAESEELKSLLKVKEESEKVGLKLNIQWWTGKPGVLQSMGLQNQTWLSNWTELIS